MSETTSSDPRGRLTEEALRVALEEVWQGGGQPEWISVDGRVIHAYGEMQRAQRICSPAGLRDLFPSLRCLSGRATH